MAEHPQPDLQDGSFYLPPARETYAWLRTHDPVYWDEKNELWGVFRYDDIVAIEKNKAVFISSGQEAGGYRPKLPADPSIIGIDDPEHTARRNLVSRRFTPRGVTRFEDDVRSAVNGLFDDAMAKGGRDIEVVTELAAPLPAMMIGHLLGFPHELWPKLKEWSELTIAMGGGPSFATDEGLSAVFEFAGACTELYEAKRGCPADDVMSVWVETERKGLGDYSFGLDQIVSDCLLVLDGGAETTRTVIGWMLVHLATNDEQWELLRNGADLTVAVEEFIRYVTPIHNMCRSAAVDAEVAGKTIKAGQQLALMYGSANRDEAHFADPERLDVTRSPNNHLSFGFGTHFCLGASLARLEIRLFFEELLRRVGKIHLVPGAEPVALANPFVAGLVEAHIELEPV